MKEKLKAFTLVEVIIVMALFSMIMFSVVQLLDPVSKFFVRSSNYESTNACLDNMTRAIEGNLKYADRVRGYVGYNPYENEASAREGHIVVPSSRLREHVGNFFDEFFAGRRFDNTAGKIHVLIFDNTFDESELQNIATFEEFQQQRMNQGMITHLSFTFDTYNEHLDQADDVTSTVNSMSMGLDHYKSDPWYVNQALYGNFNYHFELADRTEYDVTTTAPSGTTTTTAPTSTSTTDSNTPAETHPVVDINPANFAIRITAQEIVKVRDSVQHLGLNSATTNSLATFAMRNVLSESNLQQAGYDRKLRAATAQDADDELKNGPAADAAGKNFVLDKEVPRYSGMTRNLLNPWDGFYFIYTMPDEMQGAYEHAGVNTNNYVTSESTTASTTTTP